MLQEIKLIVMDVDGVLTDGTIIYTSNKTEIKSFNAKDGFGVTMGRQAGLQFGVITGRTSSIVKHRVDELNIGFYQAGQFDKLPALKTMMQNFAKNEVLYIGDDILDLVCKNQVGVFAAPADANLRVRQMADLVLRNNGGNGAVRELIDLILTAQNKLKITEDYFINRQSTQGVAG